MKRAISGNLNFEQESLWLHRCWWRVFEMKCVGDNYKMLTSLVILAIDIHYFFILASSINIQNMSLTLKICHQHHRHPWWIEWRPFWILFIWLKTKVTLKAFAMTLKDFCHNLSVLSPFEVHSYHFIWCFINWWIRSIVSDSIFIVQ